MKELQAALQAAHAALLESDDDDNAYELETVISMFASHKGDDPEVAKTRKLNNCHCKNCGMEWPVMATPAPVMDVAVTSQRLAKCPRCFATENIFIR